MPAENFHHPNRVVRQQDGAIYLNGGEVLNDAGNDIAGNLETVVGGVTEGYRIARGETALDGANPTPVATGLTTVVAFVATLKGTAAPGDNTSVLTVDISGSTANVYAWQNTGGTDPTLVASTGTQTFYWIAVGT